jgi:hypothetical protein
MMLKRIVMQVSGQVMAQFTVAYLLLMTCLLRTVKHLLALITQTYHSVLTLLNPLAKMLPSFKAWAVNPTTVAPSTKQGRSTAKAKATQTGSQRQTTVHQILQRVATVIKKTNALVALTKWVVSRINASKTAWTRIVHQWIQAGLKLLETVHLHLQSVLRLQSLNKKLVEKTKLVQSLLKKAVAVLTRMVYLLKVIGLKQVGTVRQRQQPAQRRRSKGH